MTLGFNEKTERVSKPGGLVGCREGVLGDILWLALWRPHSVRRALDKGAAS